MFFGVLKHGVDTQKSSDNSYQVNTHFVMLIKRKIHDDIIIQNCFNLCLNEFNR